MIIDRSNPLTRRLLFDSNFSERGGTRTFDKVQNIPGTLTNSPAWSQTLYGPGIFFDGGATGDDLVQYATVPPSLQTLTRFTIESLIYPLGSGGGGGQNARIVHKGNSSVGRFSLQTNTALSLELDVDFDTTDGVWVTSNNTITYNRWNHVVCSYDGNSLSNVPSFYVNGSSVSLLSSTQPSTNWVADDAILNVGNRSSTANRALNGYMLYSRIWNRLISPIEIKMLYANPWLIYKNDSRFRNLGKAAVTPANAFMSYRLMMGVGN